MASNAKFVNSPKQYGEHSRKYSSHDDGYGSQDYGVAGQSVANTSHGSAYSQMDFDRYKNKILRIWNDNGIEFS